MSTPSHQFMSNGNTQSKPACLRCGEEANNAAHDHHAFVPKANGAELHRDGCQQCDLGPGAFIHNMASEPKLEQEKKKESNPKDVVGSKKVSLAVLSFQVLWQIALGMMEGALKYGRHNYRVSGVRASVYFDATMRHLGRWFEGEDIDPDSGLSHITKAMTSLHVLLDSMLQGNWVDDRPPRASNQSWADAGNNGVLVLLQKYPNPVPAFTQVGVDDAAKVDTSVCTYEEAEVTTPKHSLNTLTHNSANFRLGDQLWIMNLRAEYASNRTPFDMAWEAHDTNDKIDAIKKKQKQIT